MGKFIVEAPIKGTACAEVEASSEEEAIEVAKTSGKWQIEDWDINTQSWQGGYISAQEEKPD